MKNFFALLFLLFSLCTVSQTKNSGAPTPSVIVTTMPATDTSEAYTVIEQMPGFPGGEEKMYKFLAKNIKYPTFEKENGIQGIVYVSFIIEADGKISEAKVIKGVKNGPGLDQEALRVVNMMPNWDPGKQNGKPVRVSMRFPVGFH